MVQKRTTVVDPKIVCLWVAAVIGRVSWANLSLFIVRCCASQDGFATSSEVEKWSTHDLKLARSDIPRDYDTVA